MSKQADLTFDVYIIRCDYNEDDEVLPEVKITHEEFHELSKFLENERQKTGYLLDKWRALQLSFEETMQLGEKIKNVDSLKNLHLVIDKAISQKRRIGIYG